MKQGIDTMGGIGQRHAMGMGGEMAAGNFGVKSHDYCDSGKSMGSAKSPSLSEGERAQGAPTAGGRGKMAQQAEVDHGRHK